MYSIEKIRSKVNRINKIWKNLDPQAMQIIDKQLDRVCNDLDGTISDMSYMILLNANVNKEVK